MEARRTFQGEVKNSRTWIVVAALLAAIALGLGGAFAAKGLTSSSAPASAPAKVNVVQPLLPAAPDTRDSIPAPAPYAPSHKHQTVF